MRRIPEGRTTNRTIQTPRDLRRANRALLLRRLYFDGPLSRQDLVDTMGLSAASVSNVIADLTADRLLTGAGAVESAGGRPRTLLRVDATDRHVAGAVVGETRIQVELFTLNFEPCAQADFPIEGDGCDAGTIVERIAEGLRDVMKRAGATEDTVLGLGVAVPGVVENRPDAVVHSQTIGWDAVPLERMLRPTTGLPLYFDNGATALGQAEMWFGAGRGCADAVIALIGSGVGACVVTDGVPYRGVGRSAGEWGHTVVAVGGRRCRCGARGCLEAYVGAGAVAERFRESGAHEAGLIAGLGEEDALAAILAAADRPEPLRSAVAVLDETAEYLGAGIASLINLFNPERIVLGGWAGLTLGAALLSRLRTVAEEYALRYAYRATTIELCHLGPDAIAHGAATLPVAAFLASGGVRAEARDLLR